MRNLEVCLSPELIKQYGVDNKVVVVVDILRATSCMVTALAHGVKGIIPVDSLEECEQYKKKGYIGAAERDGRIARGFDIGNSPYSYMDSTLKGKTIALTTTNGTLAIQKCSPASEIIIGAFLNKSILSNYLLNHSADVLILCAGWKGKMNLEDTLFAGALVEDLRNYFSIENDSAFAAQTLYNCAKKDLFKFVTANSSHYKRLKNLNLDKDIKYCMQQDIFPVIPIMKDGMLVKMKMEPVSVPAVKL
jgi:2-phosphosulfolactate phosphatase